MALFAQRAGSSHSRLQYILIAALTLLITLQVLHSWQGSADPNVRDADVARDFKAFYCAGATANVGQNPYLLRQFERCGSDARGALPTFARSDMWAAPLPPYDIALFRIFAVLPYRLAALAWLVLSIAALSLAVVAIATMSGVPPLAVFAAFAMPLYYTCLQWGQLPPIVVGALAVAAYALRTRAYTVAGLACIATLLEPHLGVPVCLAVFLWAPKTRFAIAGGAVVAGILSIATLGMSTTVEYLRTVLPLQALAEVPAENQYSLTWLAYLAGVPEHVALQLGILGYALMSALGIWLARAVARASAAEEFLPVVPAALIVVGGPYMHVTQTSVSLLLGIMLLGFVGRASPLLWLGILLQMPLWYVAAWQTRPLTLTRVDSVVAIAAFVFILAGGVSQSRRLAAAALAAGAYIACSFMILHTPNTVIRVPATVSAYEGQLGADRQYTTGAWGIHVRVLPALRISTLRSLASKLPVWLGLVLLVLGSISYVRGVPAADTRGRDERRLDALRRRPT